MITVYNEFPEAWLANENILYHGTCRYFEKEIDAKGLIIPEVSVSNGIVEKLKDIYKNDLHEFIDSSAQGGFINLPFYESEILSHNCRPISFAFHPSRCTLYASEDFAGGELARTVIQCFLYLQNLCTSEDARTQWQDEFKIMIEYNSHVLAYDLLRHVTELNIIQLQEKLETLRPVYDNYLRIRDNYEYGVIYAIDSLNIKKSCFTKESKGLYSLCSVSQEHIIGKIIWTKPSEDSCS